MKQLLYLLPCLLLAGCAQFVNDSQKTINSAAILADGAMSGYGQWWKDQIQHTNVNQLQMWQQRTNVEALSIKTGTSLATAQKALDDYRANSGASSQSFVNSLILTAVQDAETVVATVSLDRTNNAALVQSKGQGL